MPGTVSDLLYGWWNWLGKQGSDIWNLVPLYLMWTVWKERNRRTFENMELTRDALANLFFRTLSDWAQGWGFTNCISLSDFLFSIQIS
jgi:hypothetical protein